MKRLSGCCAVAALGLLAAAASGRDVRPVPSSEIDALFASWTRATPGCAVGVSVGDRIVLEKAYGMADLEHEVANAPDTIFEAGSVSKQFTAMAVLLLAKDGKLSLDDPVRRYIPELPENGAAITIRQMLQHTSGLRDWGSIEDIAGWPRGSRVYTHAHVLDIVGRQSRLNFPPGTRWSYSNTGYNLAAILVSRVAGEPFAEFTRKRIFEPLGMTRTSWRDDFTRVVKGRAIAYAASEAGYKSDMPFENIHGNGGLLTTVGDLLRWNRNFTDMRVGDAALLQEAQTPGRLGSGQEHGYAFGLSVDRYKGLREIRHSGTTASYRAYLSRFPDQDVSVALLCNAGDSMPRKSLHAVADLYLADALEPEADPPAVEVADAELDALAGLYRNVERGDVIRIERDGTALKFGDGMTLVALSRARFTDRDGTFIEFDGRDATLDDGSGAPIRLEKMAQARPTAAELQALTGTYTSDDAEVTLRVQLRDGTLAILRRPDGVFPLTPLYADAFDSELGTVIFRRDDAGRPAELGVVQDRVWDLRFRRDAQANPAAQNQASFVDRPGTPHVRVMTWNISRNSIFDEPGSRISDRSDGLRPGRFRRLAKALAPDIVCLQEVFPPRNAAEVARILDGALPLSGGARWQAHGRDDIVIASRFPISMQDARREDWGGGAPRTHAMALIDLPASLGTADLYAICAHMQSRSEPKDIAARQEQADAIASWVRDLRNAGGSVDLPARTPILVLGDFNAYKTDPANHIATLLGGAIVNRQRFGPGGPPDWDDSPLRDALPTHNAGGVLTYTFGDGADDVFPPAPLDRVLFTDSVFGPLNGFVLDTTTLDPVLLARFGLQEDDILLHAGNRLFDHLPVVVDFAPRANLQ